MRMIPAMALLMLGACNVDNDAANEQVRLDYDRERIENAARTAAGTAREVGAAAGNVASTTGRAIRNEVGDIDVDVDVTRNRSREAGNEAQAR